MTTYQRPWWAIAMQLPAFKTTLEENHQNVVKQFVIEGEPVLRSFAWVTYGPLAAVGGVVLMGIVAWAIDISNQPGSSRIAFACGMFAIPALMWLVGGFASNKLMAHFLARETEAKKEVVQITVDTQAGVLQQNQNQPIALADITGFKLVSDSGFDYEPEKDSNPLVHLMVETKQGQVNLLRKHLGTAQQKQQIISKLKALIELGSNTGKQ